MENRDVFVSERSRTSARFTKPIHKTTITTFASKSFERKNKSKKVAELQVTKSTRDLFRRLLDLSATNGIDLENVISFPILPEPACFACTAVNRWIVQKQFTCVDCYTGRLIFSNIILHKKTIRSRLVASQAEMRKDECVPEVVAYE